MKVVVGFLVAYDYDYLKISLPLVYSCADHIILGLDCHRVSFTGKRYHFDESFKSWISAFDKEKKIEWVEQSFYRAELNPMENETRERNQLFETVTDADWYIQIDADEYFIDFASFVYQLKTNYSSQNIGKETTISVSWKSIYKQTKNGYFMIAGIQEKMGVATNSPYYQHGRNQGNTEMLHADFFMIHHSWGRSATDVKQKLDNWSHSHELDKKKFFLQWNRCNYRNYKNYRNFHPLHPPIWQYLEFVPAKSIQELIEHYKQHPPTETKVPPLPFIHRVRKKIQRMLHLSA